MNSSQLFGVLRIRLLDLFFGGHINRFLKELNDQQYYPKEETDKIKKDKFSHLFEMAKASTGYYRNTGNYNGLDVLTRDKVNTNFDNLISKEYQKKLFLKSVTGPENTPLFYLTTAEAESYLWASLILSWEVAGYKPGDKVAIFVGGPALIKTFKESIFRRFLNIDTYPATSFTAEEMLECIEQIQQSHTKIIYGYEKILTAIASYINKNGPFYFPALKGIVCNAKNFSETSRANISKAFHVAVYNHYSCDEAGISAFECEAHHLHLISTGCEYEVDKEGNLFVTDLVNEGFILMKYSTGDKVEFSTDKVCSCKRKSPVLKQVSGTEYDVHAASNENFLRSSLIKSIFQNDESIKKVQLFFDNKTISIHLTVDNPYKEKGDYNKYLDEIKKHIRFKRYNLVINVPSVETEDSYESVMISSNDKSRFENSPYYL